MTASTNEGLKLPTTALSSGTGPASGNGYLAYDPNGSGTVKYWNGIQWVSLASSVAGSSQWTTGINATYLTDNTANMSVGASDSLAAPFSVNVATQVTRIGKGSAQNGTLSLYASNGATGSLIYNTSDQFQFSGGDVQVDQNLLVGSNATLAPLSVSGGVGSNGAFIVNQTNSGDIIDASASGTTKFEVANNGNLLFAGSTGNLSTLTKTGSTSQIYTFPDATGTICISGQSCATSGIVGYFQRNSGTLSPANITDDLLLGGTATSSAKFAFINNIGSGTPTASISAGSAATGATYLTGNGGLQTTNFQTLTIGGGAGTTGSIQLAPKNTTGLFVDGSGNVGIGTTTPQSLLSVAGNGEFGSGD